MYILVVSLSALSLTRKSYIYIQGEQAYKQQLRIYMASPICLGICLLHVLNYVIRKRTRILEICKCKITSEIR